MTTSMCKEKYSKEFVQKKISSESKDLNHLNQIKINSQIKDIMTNGSETKENNFKQTTEQKSEI